MSFDFEHAEEEFSKGETVGIRFEEFDVTETPFCIDGLVHSGEIAVTPHECMCGENHSVEPILLLDFVTIQDQVVRIIVPIHSPLGQVMLNGGLTGVSRKRLRDLPEPPALPPLFTMEGIDGLSD